MKTQASKLIAMADSWQGYLEKKSNAELEDLKANAGSGNYTIFGKWYGDYMKASGFINGQWCHMYVSYCAYRVGVGPDIVPYTASSSTGVTWFKKQNRWHARGSYTPQPGDIAYFSLNGRSASHVGIVRYQEAGRVYTIEGNTTANVKGEDGRLITNGGGVAKKSYSAGSKYILGFGSPAYTGMEIEELVGSVSQALGFTAPALWLAGLKGQVTISDVFMRALAAKVCNRGGKTFTPETLYVTLDGILGLHADAYWEDVLRGDVVVSTPNLIDLFLRIHTVFVGGA